MNRAPLAVGAIVQSGLNFINPVQDVVWYSYNTDSVSADGLSTNTYNLFDITARIQPVTQDLIFKNNLEFGYTYKRFYVLLDQVNTVNRNINVNSDYFGYGGLWYRVMKQDDNFTTGWVHLICQQSNTEPN